MSRDTALSNGVSDDRSLKQERDLSKWVWKIAVLGYLETEFEAENHTLDIKLFKTEITNFSPK